MFKEIEKNGNHEYFLESEDIYFFYYIPQLFFKFIQK